MPLVVEDGTGLPAATSAVSLEAAQAFVSARGLEVALTDALLVRAMDALSGVPLDGQKTVPASGLPVPRTDLADAEGTPIDPNTVPAGYVAAQVWLAVHIAQGDDPAAVPEPAIKREKVGPIDTEFAVGSNGLTAARSPLDFPRVRDALRGLVAAGSVDRPSTGAFGGGQLNRS